MRKRCPRTDPHTATPGRHLDEAPPRLTEKDFQRQVLDLARILGWSSYHPMLSKWSERGWPDLAMVRPPRLVFAELKSERGRTSVHQERWLALLGACDGVEVFLWRPSDLERIAEVLR
jgi:hypothetical protein